MQRALSAGLPEDASDEQVVDWEQAHRSTPRERMARVEAAARRLAAGDTVKGSVDTTSASLPHPSSSERGHEAEKEEKEKEEHTAVRVAKEPARAPPLAPIPTPPAHAFLTTSFQFLRAQYIAHAKNVTLAWNPPIPSSTCQR